MTAPVSTLAAPEFCERSSCRVRLRATGRPAVVVFVDAAGDRLDFVRAYCSHRCEILARPKVPWGTRRGRLAAARRSR